MPGYADNPNAKVIYFASVTFNIKDISKQTFNWLYKTWKPQSGGGTDDVMVWSWSYSSQKFADRQIKKIKTFFDDRSVVVDLQTEKVEVESRGPTNEELKEIIRNLLDWFEEEPVWVDEGQKGWVLYKDAHGLSKDLMAAKEAVS